jgi:hypothetical protein
METAPVNKEARNADIRHRRVAGETLKAIGARYGITTARVGQILRETPRPPPLPPVVAVEIVSVEWPSPVEGERPMWSKPDQITLRLVREAREEMEREESRDSMG